MSGPAARRLHMSTFQIYLWCHLALAAALLALGIRRAVRRDPLVFFGEDMLLALIAFMFIGGGAIGAAHYLT
jgi:hypothetical protein